MSHSSCVAIATRDSACEQRVEAGDEARPHLLESLVRDRLRLDVDALAETDHGRSGARSAMSASVRLSAAWRTIPTPSRPPSRSSRYRPSVASVVLESSMSMRTKIPRAAAFAHELADERPAEIDVQLQPETCQLDRDVRLEAVGLDRRQGVAVRPCDRLGLVGPGDLLAQHVDRGPRALGVESGDDPPGVVERRSGDVRRRDTAHDRPRHGGEHTDHGAVEQPQGGRDPRRDVASAVSQPQRTTPVTRPVAASRATHSRMKPWRAAETSATASGNSTRIASRSWSACSSTVPDG